MRQAAGLIRDLRGLGESYLDWFSQDGLDGVYPDERSEREASLRDHIERIAKLAQSNEQLPANQRTEIEEMWRKGLETTQRALAKLDENADVFAALHTHLSRLGWRTENAADRAKSDRARTDRGLAVLQDIKAAEQRPEDTPADWTAPLRPRPNARTRTFSTWWPADQAVSEDERVVRSGGLRPRLNRLATTGRISKDEYDAFMARLKEFGP